MLNDIKLLEPLQCGLKEGAIAVAKKLKGSMQRHIYVVDKNNMPVGIISTTDINNKIVAEGKDAKLTCAKDIMSSPIEVYDVKEDMIAVYKEMMAKKRLTSAVVENGRFIGVLTLNSLISHITAGGVRK